jgi:hypothetical protein
MNMTLALKRSYRYFIPAFILEPRRTVRVLFSPLLCFITGISVGAELYCDRSQMGRIGAFTAGATIALLLLNWWASSNIPYRAMLSCFRGRTAVASLCLLLGACSLFAGAFGVSFQDRSNLQFGLHALKTGILFVAIGLVLPSPPRKAG